MRTGNRYATWQLLVALEEALESSVNSSMEESVKESLALVIPWLHDKDRRFYNNFRVHYDADVNLKKLKVMTVLERSWTCPKTELVHKRKTKPCSNRNILARAYDSWKEEGFEVRKDVSVESAIVRELALRKIEPFASSAVRWKRKGNAGLVNVIVPKRFKKFDGYDYK